MNRTRKWRTDLKEAPDEERNLYHKDLLGFDKAAAHQTRKEGKNCNDRRKGSEAWW
jgi:hypothetical protein